MTSNLAPGILSEILLALSTGVAESFLYKRKVIGIRQAADGVVGVSLDDGREINAPIVINVAGPHSFKITELAGQSRHNVIKTRALRHEVHVVPPPDGFKPEEEGYHTNDTDIVVPIIDLRPEESFAARPLKTFIWGIKGSRKNTLTQ